MKPGLPALLLILLGAAFLAAVGLQSSLDAFAWLEKTHPGFMVGGAAQVAPVAAPGWAFHRLDLRAHDRVLAVAGEPVDCAVSFRRELDRHPPGKALSILLERSGQAFSIAVVPELFGWSDLFWAFLFPFLIGACYYFVGGALFLARSRFGPSGLFAALCWTLSIFFFTYFDAYADRRLVLVLDLALALLPALVMHLALVFPQRARLVERFPAVQFLVYLGPLAVSLLKEYYERVDYRVWMELDRILDGILFGSFLALFVVLALRSRRAATTILRARARTALIGMLVSFIVPGAAIAATALGGGGSINLLQAFTLIFPFYLGHAVVRHNLFDAERLWVNTVFYVLAGAGVSLVLLLVAPAVGLAIFDGLAAVEAFLLTALFGFVMFGLSRLREKFQVVVDRVFFHNRIDSDALVREVGETFRVLPNAETGIRAALTSFLARLNIRRAAVFIPDGAGGLRARYAAGLELPALRFSEETARFLAAAERPFTPHDVVEGGLPRAIAGELDGLFCGSGALILVPGVAGNSLLELLLVGEKEDGHGYTRREIEILAALAAQLALSRERAGLLAQAGERERLEREMQLAAEIQKGLWPTRRPEVPGCAVGWRLLPARQVGGDLLDIDCDGQGCLRLVIGDVSGKGLPAAVFGESARGMVEMAWQAGLAPGAVLGGMNRLFCAKADGTGPRINLALAAAVIDGSARRVRFANAGFPYPVRVPADGKPPFFLELPGLPLAVLPGIVYREHEFLVDPGEALVFASDGITETRNRRGSLFGFERLLAILGRSAALPPEQVIANLIAELRAFSGGLEQTDDRAVLVIRFDPA